MKTRALLALACAAVLTVAGPRPASGGEDRGFELTSGEIVVRTAPGIDMDRRRAYAVAKAAREGLKELDRLVDLDEDAIFFRRTELPSWMPDREATDDKLVVELVPPGEEGEGAAGREAVRTRMVKDGELRLVLPIPAGDDPTPEEAYRIRRDVVEAALVAAYCDSLPRWLRAGLPIAAAAGEESPPLAAIREELAAAKALSASGLLRAVEPAELDAAGGAAGCFALVRLLLEADKDLLPAILANEWEIGSHLIRAPDERAVLAQCTASVADALAAAGADAETLDGALPAWIAEGSPTGAEFRRSETGKGLRRLDEPDRYGVDVQGGWGSKLLRVPGRNEYAAEFSGGSLAWRLPWPDARVECDAYLATEGGENWLREDAELKYRGRHRLGSWSGKPTGRVSLEKKLWTNGPTSGFGILFVNVRSPAGAEYRWFRQTRF